MASHFRRYRHGKHAFTLIELLVVVSIISLLISILMPSLGRARDQAKGVHCLAKLKDIGTAIATYENRGDGALPPARWSPAEEDLEPGIHGERAVEYGWVELLYEYLYDEEVRSREAYPVQRNIQPPRWEKYFQCKAAGEDGPSSGHYRVYLPAWSAGTYSLEMDGRYGDRTRANPDRGAFRDRIRPRLPLIGDANEFSERGDGEGDDDCSYIDAGEANYAGTDGRLLGNRFSDRHSGGANYLFQDLHAAWSTSLRELLARDYDLNAVEDIDVAP